MTMKINQNPPISDELYQQLIGLERDWENSQVRLSDKELLTIFPEAKPVIPEKLQEWQSIRDEITTSIKKKLTIIKRSGADEGTQFFWREWIKLNDGEKLVEADVHVSRLKRLLYLIRDQPKSKHRISEEQIQQARLVPLDKFIDGPIKKHGKTWIGLCPFHKEKHPSFCVYPNTNRFWCYGQCNDGGDAIKFVRLLHGYSFREAVKYLLGQK
ncbi:MAG: hypothetical protein A2629_00080 [Candidatus Levybacteria bacterium RIFCSPHIGHO2_01_FULL_41_15]|nr:MAG: hypothetical protein A2629_00080 [Candidatus Levybacteria bacterium RIFCSPHIGHO2_01_FULL_41_15]